MTQHIVPFVDHEIGYRLLQKLISYSAENQFEIPAVVTTRENQTGWWLSVNELCQEANIPLFIYEENFCVDFLNRKPDWFLLLSWKYIIPMELIKLPKYGVLNLHYSLLPEFRGVYPVNWAIIEGRDHTGFTYHFVNEVIDGGEIFMQIKTPVHVGDNARSLQSRLDNLVCEHSEELIDRMLKYTSEDKIFSVGNSVEIADRYYSRAKFNETCCIDLEKRYQGKEFLNLLRGLTFFHDSKNAYIIDSKSGKRIYISLILMED